MTEAAAAAIELYRDGKNWCYLHPNQLVIGVCAFCLNQKLLVLAASDQHRNGSHRRRRRRRRGRTIPHIHLPKIFALTNSFLHQRKTQDQRSSFIHSSSSPSTQEESFISIKFEENGAASWEKSTTMATAEKYCDVSSWNQNELKKKKEEGAEGGFVRAVMVVEPRGGAGGGGGASSSLRWRKRIGHLFQLMRWKRSSSSSSSAAMGNVGTKLEGHHHVKVRHGWITTLTKNNNNNSKAGGLMSTQTPNRCS